MQHSREEVYNRAQVVQENIKNIFDKRTKADDFSLGDKVLKWDSRREDKGKHGKFENICKCPYVLLSEEIMHFSSKSWMEQSCQEVLLIADAKALLLISTHISFIPL